MRRIHALRLLFIYKENSFFFSAIDSDVSKKNKLPSVPTTAVVVTNVVDRRCGILTDCRGAAAIDCIRLPQEPNPGTSFHLSRPAVVGWDFLASFGYLRV